MRMTTWCPTTLTKKCNCCSNIYIQGHLIDEIVSFANALSSSAWSELSERACVNQPRFTAMDW